MKVSTVERMREMDRRAMDIYGLKDELLMENAGNASFFAFFNESKGKGKNIAVVVGSGNNGGDGLVVARKFFSLGAMGYNVKIFLCSDPAKFKNSTLMNYEIVKKIGIPTEQIDNTEDFSKVLKKYDVIVDAIFGTGLGRDITGHYREVVDVINRSGKFVCSIDIPSGINGNTGQVMGTAVKANCTVTFGAPKLGNILYPGYNHCGKLFVTRISFPPEIYDADDIHTMINMPEELPLRDESGHKGSFGDVLFIAGAKNYYGAPYFSSISFLKAGGGYSRLATPISVAPFIASKGNEIVLVPLKETEEGTISAENVDMLLKLSGEVDFVVIGPGLSLNSETGKLVREFVSKVEKPVLIDGDGLTHVASGLESIKNRKDTTVLTPHPGEMARLTKLSIKDVVNNRVEIVRKTAMDLNAIIVLKTAHSLVAYPDGNIFINTTGNSALATAGSGDVLTGVIAAMKGLGLNTENAVSTGVFMHGLAGEFASAKLGKDGVTAQDILEHLPITVKEYRENYNNITRDYHGKIFMI